VTLSGIVSRPGEEAYQSSNRSSHSSWYQWSLYSRNSERCFGWGWRKI